MWTSGTLLLNAVFYIVGKHFCLHGGQEHRDNKLSQVKKGQDHYVYYENVAKNNNGSFKNLHVKSTIVPVYPVPKAGERCPVHILDNYFSKLSKEMEKVPNDSKKPWYAAVAVGKNTLANLVKNICAKAGIDGNNSNHSLRASCISSLCNGGVSEKVINEISGHR